jgi:hypothetical protein
VVLAGAACRRDQAKICACHAFCMVINGYENQNSIKFMHRIGVFNHARGLLAPRPQNLFFSIPSTYADPRKTACRHPV